MAFEDLEYKECLCAFVRILGDYTETLKGLIDSAVSLLTTVKTLLNLIPQDFADHLEKYLLQTELAALEVALLYIEAPLNTINAYTKPFADCPPVASMAKVITDFKEEVLGTLYDYQNEVEQKVEALNLEGMRVEIIDNWITVLNDLKESFVACQEL